MITPQEAAKLATNANIANSSSVKQTLNSIEAFAKDGQRKYVTYSLAPNEVTYLRTLGWNITYGINNQAIITW